MATKTTYGEQLKHPNWQRKRLEVLQDAGFHCERCGDGESTLHVHHKHYVKDRMAWEYSRQELSALCETCHEAEHAQWPVRSALLGMLDVDGGPWSIDKFLAHGAGAISAWGTPPHLAELFKQIKTDNERDFLTGFMAERISLAMLTVNMRALSAAVDQDGFVSDLTDLLRRHGLVLADEPWSATGKAMAEEFGA